MVRSSLLAVSSFLILSGCAASRKVAAPEQASAPELLFAGGTLRTVPPVGWLFKRDVAMMGPEGQVTKFALMLGNPRTGTTIVVIPFLSETASPIAMADRLQGGTRQKGAVVSEVDFSMEDEGRRASFTFRVDDDGKVVLGKTVVRRVNDAVSVAVIGTWIADAAADEKVMDAVESGIATRAAPK